MKKPQQPDPQMFSATPSHNGSIRAVSEILKRANQLIQNGELERAQGELLLANRAAKERFIKLISSSPSKKNIPSVENTLSPLPLAPMEAFIAATTPQKQATNISPQAAPQSQKSSSGKLKGSQPEQTNERNIEFDCYRDALGKAWADGALSADEERQLQELRTVLEISENEHEILEKEVKYACYRDALSQRISNDCMAIPNTKSPEELREVFHLSQKEHDYIQNNFINPQIDTQRDKIFIIDDDPQFLEMLTSLMTEEGFDVAAVTTSDEASTLLMEYTPDLILCDVNLKTSTMNGFTFYQRVQAYKNLQHIPFIFITGLKDENIASTGKELGADDFLMKPISKNSLLATLHGRLKRFKQLKGFSGTQTPAYC